MSTTHDDELGNDDDEEVGEGERIRGMREKRWGLNKPTIIVMVRLLPNIRPTRCIIGARTLTQKGSSQ